MKKLPLAVGAVVAIGVATAALADSNILDDLIVDGSLCIGLDCVNNEDFGFNTVVLKENNLRIRFQDTSSSASFPSNDWRIEINDAINGGANYFGVVDEGTGAMPLRVEAGAPVGSLFVGSDGHVGFGTQQPRQAVEVSRGDTPVVRLQQDGTAGWTPQGWDVGGNESNFFVRDVEAGTLPLRIQPGAPDNSLIITSDGNVTLTGTLSQGSSRTFKHDIRAVDAEEVLARVKALKVLRWRYLRDASGSEHLGPMAEDFHAAFGLGPDEKHLASTDVAGVAVASVQALSRVVEAQEQELLGVRKQNEELRRRLERLEKRLSR